MCCTFIEQHSANLAAYSLQLSLPSLSTGWCTSLVDKLGLALLFGREPSKGYGV